MHKRLLLHKVLGETLSFMHKKRQQVLFEAVNSLMGGAKLTLTSLGRHLEGKAKERNQIRKMDRLLSNKHLHSERFELYKKISALLIKDQRPVIAVDWSCLNYAEGRYLLRASMSVKGRSLVCYQEVHPKENENNTEAHNAFLAKLKLILPAEVKPVIVTDAVFSAMWFKKIVSLGWAFVGRVRQNRGSYCDLSQNKWLPIKAGYKAATLTPTELGEVLLTKKNKLRCQLITYKRTPKGRKKKNRKGTLAKGSYEKVHAKEGREPWLIATSLDMNQYTAKSIVKFYSKRMQIEEEFRDTKSSRYGFGLCESRTKNFARVETLLIINLLAAIFCWILACMTIQKRAHVDYHANSLKNTQVLSAMTLGRRVFRRETQLAICEFILGFKLFIKLICAGEYNVID